MRPLGLFIWPYYPEVNLPHDLAGIINCLVQTGGSNYLTDLQFNVGSRGLLSVVGFLEAKEVVCDYVPLDYYQTFMSADEILGLIKQRMEANHPRFVGVSSTTLTFPCAVEILNYCKSLDPDIIAIVGGYHVTFLDESALREAPCIDVVVRGEGEWTMLELAQLIAQQQLDFSHVQGITYRAADGHIVRNPDRPFGDLNELAVPAYHLLPDSLLQQRFCTSIIPTRGCNYNCAFCVETRLWRGQVRYLPLDLILKEVKLLTRTYNADVNFEDSIFMGWPNSGTRLENFCQSLSELDIRFGYALLRVDLIDDYVLTQLKKANITSIWVGAESTSSTVLETIQKGITSNQMVQAFEKARGYDIDVCTFWIAGHPGDNTVNSAYSLQMMEFFLKEGLNQRQENHIFVPFPGSPSFFEPEQFGMKILSYDWRQYHHNNYPPIISYDDFSPFEIWTSYLATLGMKLRYYATNNNSKVQLRPETFFSTLERVREPLKQFVSTEKY